MNYTADDFKKATFARHPQWGNRAARRPDSSYEFAWRDVSDVVYTDTDMAETGWVPVQESRPLTPDDITDAMVERACRRLRDIDDDGISLRGTWTAREVLLAALTQPPSRPEGAEELAELVTEWDDMEGLSESQRTDLADFLAARLTITPKGQA